MKTEDSCVPPWEAARKQAKIAAAASQLLKWQQVHFHISAKPSLLVGLSQGKAFAPLRVLGWEMEGSGTAACL